MPIKGFILQPVNERDPCRVFLLLHFEFSAQKILKMSPVPWFLDVWWLPESTRACLVCSSSDDPYWQGQSPRRSLKRVYELRASGTLRFSAVLALGLGRVRCREAPRLPKVVKHVLTRDVS